MRYKIVDSIAHVKRQDWDTVFGFTPEGYDFYKTLEESNFPEYSFHYILLYNASGIAAIAPLFTADFGLDTTLDGAARNAIRSMRRVFPGFLIQKTLFCGSPFGEKGLVGIRKGVSSERLMISRISKIIRIFCRRNRIHFIIFKDFSKDDASMLESLGKGGFFRVKSLPSVITDVKFGSMDEYLGTLSYSTRKDLRRKVKKARANADVEVKIADDVTHIIDDVYRLYLKTYEAGEIKFEKLTKEFFISVSKNLSPHAKYFLYYVNGKLAAFNLCFVHKDLFIDKFIGFDFDLSRRYNLYFLSWFHNVETCLKNSIPYYQTGQTDYDPKVRLGGRIVPLHAYVRHTNPVFNLCFRSLARVLKA
ncbi:MAG: GNAT family N-acetyltransferase [Candidatus Omnitrophota bacterium]